MLRKDQQVFLDFVSGQNPRIENALLELKARERGHFEDHPAVKPLVVSSLSGKNCKHLPTVLYLMSTFGDMGALLVPLASNPDREVRWRVAYLISRMRALDLGMRLALAILETDKDDTTRVYVEACKGIA